MSAVIKGAPGDPRSLEVTTAGPHTAGLVVRDPREPVDLSIELDEAGTYQLVRALIEHQPTSHEAEGWLVALGERLGYEVIARPKPPVWQEEDVVLVNYSDRWRSAFVTTPTRDFPVITSFGETQTLNWLDDQFRHGRARLVMRDRETMVL